MGSKSQTQTTSQTTTPVNQQALQDIYKTVSGAASTPYQAYNGELVAPVNQQQTAGINAINNAAGYASPYIQNAASLVQGAANPLTASQIQQYQNPYTQAVVNATQAQFNDQNAQAQNALKGSAASAGALGGDRQAVAQTTLAKNQAIAQNPVIAGLYSQGYNQAVQTAQQQFQQNPLAAASSLGNLGVAGQNAALQGANAQVGAGTLQQQTQQQADQAALQQWQQQQAYPYAQAAFLQQYGLPTALAQGSTSNGTQTTPGANPWSQILGLGTAALTAYSDERVKENIKEVGKTNDGQPIYKFNYIGSPMTQIGLMAQDVEKHKPEAVGESGGIKTVDYDAATKDAEKYASGGSLPYGGVPYIPIGGASNARLDAPNLQFAKPQDSGSGDAAGKFLGTLASKGKGMFGSSGGFSGAPAAMGTDAVMGLGGLYADGGFVDAIHKIHGTIRRATGGAVGNTPFQSYADGGLTFADRWSPLDTFDVPKADNASPFPVIQAVPEQAMEDWRKGVDKPNDALIADAGMPGPDPSVPSPIPSPPPTQTAGLPRAITNPDDVPEQPSEAMAYSPQAPMAIAPPGQPGGMGASPMAPVAQAAPQGSPQPESRFGSFNPLGLSDKAREAIIAGALGVAASRSPFVGTAIAEGGLRGMGAYSQATQAEQEAADKAAQRGQEQQRIDIQAKQLAANIENQRRTAASASLIPDGKGGMMVNPAYIKLKEAEEEAKNYKPTYGVVKKEIDPDTGVVHDVYGWIDPNTRKVTDSEGKPLSDQPAASRAAPILDKDGNPITGEEFLKTLSPQRAELARKIGNYEVNPAGLSLRGGRREQAIADASRYNPAYDQRNYGATNAAIKNYNAGPESRTVRSLNVSIDHLGTLDEAAKALQNGNTPVLNKIVNTWREKTGSPLTTNFDSIKQVVSAEIAKAVVGGQTALHDRDDMAQRAANSQSPDQLSGIISQFKKLMAGQMKGLRHSYEATTGLKDFDKYLEPQTKKELEAFGGTGSESSKPTLNQFLEKARAANPGRSDEELSKFYKQKYGG